jgi:hypothetical protein
MANVEISSAGHECERRYEMSERDKIEQALYVATWECDSRRTPPEELVNTLIVLFAEKPWFARELLPEGWRVVPEEAVSDGFCIGGKHILSGGLYVDNNFISHHNGCSWSTDDSSGPEQER